MKKILILFLFASIIFSSCEKTEIMNPSIFFGASVSGNTVTFLNFNKDFDSFFWEFGDGESSDEISPVHKYRESGKFTVTLTATKGDIKESFQDVITVIDPIAEFRYSISGDLVTFNNLSVNFDSYLWDFGDGESSTKAYPIHTYKSKGTYVVTLTALKGNYKSIVKDTLNLDFKIKPIITIDGSFDDWKTVDYAFQNTSSEGGTIKSLKTMYSDTHLYFLVEGTDKMSLNFFDLAIDIDNDNQTGEVFTGWFPYGSGFEYLFEDLVLLKGSGGWRWSVVSLPPDFYKGSLAVKVNGTTLKEFSIRKDTFGDELQKNINVAVVEQVAGKVTGIIPVQEINMRTLIPMETKD